MSNTTIPYEVIKQEALRDPEVKAAYDALEPAYQVARLRILRGLTQEQLAQLVGTKQPCIARLESGKTVPRLDFLRRVVEALGGRLTVKIEGLDEAPTIEHGVPVDRVMKREELEKIIKAARDRGERPDLSAYDFSQTSLDTLDLHWAILAGPLCSLVGANIRGADLSRTDLSQTCLVECPPAGIYRPDQEIMPSPEPLRTTYDKATEFPKGFIPPAEWERVD